MAIDLFANFERTNNSSIFYRKTGYGSYPVLIRLMDLDNPEITYTSTLSAEYSINGGTYKPLSPLGNMFQDYILFNSQVPSLCSISARLKNATSQIVINTYNISCKFITGFPNANFVIYPKHVPYLDPSTGNVGVNILTPLTYNDSPGTSFYGEGHTERFNLTRVTENFSPIDENYSLQSHVWLVGNPIHTLVQNSKARKVWSTNDSFVPVDLDNIASLVDITTVPSEVNEYPVSLFVYDANITNDSPFITYDDFSGQPMYYPYFYSTQDLNGNSNPNNYKLRDSIKVLPYPTTSNISFISDLSSSNKFYLPVNFTNKTFSSSVIVPSLTSLVRQKYLGSRWNTHAVSVDGEWGGDGDALVTSPLLTATSYSFPLAYDNTVNGFLDYFTTSSINDTSVTITVSSYQEFSINAAPGDWKPRQVTYTNKATTVIKPLPFGKKLFTPNYFNIKGTPVKFYLITDKEQTEYKINSVTIYSENTTNVLTLTSAPLAGNLVFTKSGAATINAKFVVSHLPTNTQQTFEVTFQNMIEILDYYDDTNEKYYYTELTNITLPYKEQPKLSPNEWATADNVNRVLTQLYNTALSIDSYAYRYQKYFCFYGWLGLSNEESPLVWQDAECPVANEADVRWSTYECASGSSACFTTNTALKQNITWEDNDCPDPNPNCIGAHCVKWKWNIEKNKFQDNCITWSQVKCLTQQGEFGTKWKNNMPCDSMSDLNCIKSNWRICNTDPSYFPLNNCEQTSYRCEFASVIPYEAKDQTFLVYSTEVHLVENDYNMSPVALQKYADDTNAFQKIVGASLSPTNNLYVLDSVLSKVTMLQIINGSFYLASTWGKFGYKNSVDGINNPSDIHVDQHNVVWIADTGNKCIKKFAFNGKRLGVISHDLFEQDAPRSVCVDSQSNVHVLLKQKVLVFDYEGTFVFSYNLFDQVESARKINTSYNRECVYISYGTGIVKYFKNGVIAYPLANNHKCSNEDIIRNINYSYQDSYRNVYVVAGEKILKVADLMRIERLKAEALDQGSWNLNELLIHEEEYIQPWVYLKSFHRLWDAIELLRSSLFYEEEGCKKYKPAIYEKQELTIGQNEIVSNAVINRLSKQLWDNIETLFEYFDPSCRQNVSSTVQFESCCSMKNSNLLVDPANCNTTNIASNINLL